LHVNANPIAWFEIFSVVSNLHLIMWLVFSKYGVEKKEVDEKKVEGEDSFLNLAKWMQGAMKEH
jgi:hypothetical protein